MVHATNGNVGTFAHILQSLPDYSELLIALLILILLLVSVDEIVDFLYMVRELFTFRNMPFS
ncbi:hypothetical protein [Methanolobus sp. ZRKC5]|uniref:hypothetical protein n=1 Tax=unclassified Methanolobus TaxID=2629569 RepID=UPI00313B7C87